MSFFQLKQNEEDTSQIYFKTSQLTKEKSFFKGIKIKGDFKKPLKAIVKMESLIRGKPLGNFFESDTALIVSERFVNFLESANIKNIQLFPAVLMTPDKHKTWKDFYALNVIGVQRVPNMNARKQSSSDLMLFRRAEDPACLCVDNRFEKALQKERKISGLGPWYLDLWKSYDFIWFRNEHFKTWRRPVMLFAVTTIPSLTGKRIRKSKCVNL